MQTGKTFIIYYKNNPVSINTNFIGDNARNYTLMIIGDLITAFKNEVSQLFKDTPIVYLKLHELQAVNQQNIQYNPTALDIEHLLAEFPHLTKFVIVNSGNC